MVHDVGEMNGVQLVAFEEFRHCIGHVYRAPRCVSTTSKLSALIYLTYQ